MALVNVDSRERKVVAGNVVIKSIQVDIAANNDTFTPAQHGMKTILWWGARAEGAVAVGGTESGGTITFAVGAAANNVDVLILGFEG
jgi:hypothetical protein